jgi:ArsR family transcriptional regulator, arsenate/arsenite/antimonite-responsive transcriptional repressor
MPPVTVDRSPFLGDGDDPEAVAAIAKALGHPARVRIVRLLLERRTCIGGDIVDDIGLAQSTVSEHLRILKAAGVIQGEVERPRVCYALNPASLAPLAALVDAVQSTRQRSLEPACS